MVREPLFVSAVRSTGRFIMTSFLLIATIAAVLIHTTIAWIISVRKSRADVIDPFWGPGFVLVATVTAIASDSKPSRAGWVLLALVTIWGIRLGWHLLKRWLKEEHEDRRYAAMRHAGNARWWLRSLVTVFWLQAVILWIVATPLIYAISSEEPFFLPGVISGIALFCVGLFFEAVGDYQLTQFRQQPDSQGKVMDRGLWKYTRHPNYFGDFTVWWGFFTFSVSCGAPWWTVVSPLIMSVLLMKFSGVGMLEKDISNRRPGYQDYVKRTNAFFPWIPKQAD